MVSQAQSDQARRKAESKMISEFLIDSGEFTGGAWDEPTLSYTPKVSIPSYEGIGEWVAAGTSPREVDAAGQILVVQSPELRLPVGDAANVQPGQSGIVTKNPLDPSLVGTKFRIAGNHNQTSATSRRFPVEVS